MERDLVRLWEASGRGSLVGVLPPPQSLELAGLATAAATLAEKGGLPLQRRGHRSRAVARPARPCGHRPPLARPTVLTLAEFPDAEHIEADPAELAELHDVMTRPLPPAF